jgi:hypothetical protein
VGCFCFTRNSRIPKARGAQISEIQCKNALSRIADALFNPSFGFGSPQSILLICFRQFWEPPFAVGNRFHPAPVRALDRLLVFENLFIFPRIGWFGLLTVFRRLPWTWRRSRRWFVAASHTSDAHARARQSSRNLSVLHRLPPPPSSAAFPRRVWTERRLHPAPSVSALEPLPRTNMTRLVGAFVLLLALSCASPVAGQAASAQGGMYYGPFRGPLYG